MSVPATNVAIYVDANNGSDSLNTGVLDSPYQTLSKALTEIKSGGLIILQDGSYSVGGYGTITKNVSIRNANGSDPIITDMLSFVNAQGIVQGIKFTTGKINVNNAGFGGIEVYNCDFDGQDYPIRVISSNYVAIHQNRFYGYTEAIYVFTCREMNVSGNYFYGGADPNGRAIFINGVDWLDVYHNTIDGANDLGGYVPEDVNLRIIYTSVNSLIINRKSIPLPSFAVSNKYGYDVAINVVNGPSQQYGKDYTVTNNGITVSWDGLDLENELNSNDILRIMYSEGPSPASGDAISAFSVYNSNSRIDSNNITDAEVGVYFDDNLRIRFNNFYDTKLFYDGIPTDGGATGSITGAPNYVSGIGNYQLQADSPDIDYADPIRWDMILTEMGIGVTGGHYIPVSSPTGRAGITPFNRNKDKEGRRRLSRSDRDDIGAYEYPSTGINPEAYSYINESGFDLINPGSITGPFSTIDRGFTGLKDLLVQTNRLGKLIVKPDGTHIGITGLNFSETGYYGYSRYISKNINLEDLRLMIGNSNKESIAYFYSMYPSNTPTGAYVGLPVNNLSGDTGTKNNPYRTIDEAMSENPVATTIYVKPGIYPTFTGISGKKLMGIPELNYLGYNNSQFNLFNSTGWTGNSGYVLGGSDLTFSSDTAVESNFRLFENIFIRMDVEIVKDSMEFKIYNSSNYISVKKYNNILMIKYYTGGSSYISTMISTDTTYKLTFSIENSSALVKVKGDNTDVEKSITLVSGYSEAWTLRISYEDSAESGATSVVSALNATANSLTGVQGITGTAMSRKVFGIAGVQGLSGLYELYGDRK